MQLPAWMASKPRFDCCSAMRGIVVENGVYFQPSRHLPLTSAQEAQKLLLCVLSMCFADDFTGGHIERSKQ